MELSAVGAQFTTGEGAWGVLTGLKGCQEAPPEGEEAGDAPVWKHEDITLRYPSGHPEAKDVAGAWILNFDGGCRKGMGSGGWILCGPDGRCHAGGGWYYGREGPTNNVAEAQTMARAVALVKEGGWVEHRGKLLVRGDADLIIKFLNKSARPGKRELVVMVKRTQEALRGWGRTVHFQWVPREENKMADWLSNVAASREADVTLPEL